MKKLVHVSLLVLATVALISFVGCKNEPDPEPAPSNFVGTWRSTDGSTTCTITADSFKTELEEIPQPLSGTYTVSSDGKTLTTSEIPLPEGLVEEMGVNKMTFTMTLKNGESDVAALPKGEEDELILVKKSTSKPDLTGTWTGKVDAGKESPVNATIVFANSKATLNMGEDVGGDVVLDGNFFTITWEGDVMPPTTGMISASGKAWLDDGSVFTKK